MNSSETLLAHQRLCDELHELAREENRFLRLQQRSPEPAFLARKRALFERLNESVAALRQVPAASARSPEDRARLENTRTRILQLLQLDRENEQLLLQCSLSSPPRPNPSAAPAMLQKIYSRTA